MNLATDPGVVVATFQLAVIVSWATPTVVVQRGSVLPPAQSLFGEVEVTVLARIMLPVSGLFTVTENVTVTLPLPGTVPVQVRFGLV